MIQNYENKVKYKVSIYLDWGGSWQFADALQIQVCVLRDLFRQVTRKAHTERLLGRHLPSLPCLQHPQEAPCGSASSLALLTTPSLVLLKEYFWLIYKATD